MSDDGEHGDSRCGYMVAGDAGYTEELSNKPERHTLRFES